MVYIGDKSAKMTVQKVNDYGPTSIKIKDILRNKTYIIDIKDEDVEIQKNLYIFNIKEWPIQFQNGSLYEYYIYANKNMLTSGIIQCGEYTSQESKEYVTEEKNYKLYNR